MMENNSTSLSHKIRRIPRRYWILNLLAIVGYFGVLGAIKTGVSHDIMFSSSDALSYKAVGDWLAGGTDSMYVEHRPFLFPMILLILSKLGGVWLIWFFQFSLWLGSLNLVFISIEHLTGRRFLAYCGAIIFGVNLSLITLTLHALTEITTVFMFSLLVFFVVKNIDQRRETRFIHGVLLLLSIMTVVKPVFYLPLLFILLAIVPLFFRKKYVKAPRLLFMLALVLAPLFIQFGIMKVKYDSIAVSHISDRTFTRYLFAKGLSEIEEMDIRASMEVAEGYKKKEKWTYFFDHLSEYNLIFWTNVEENIKGNSTFLVFPKGYEDYHLARRMVSMNKVFFTVHCIMLPITLLLFVLFLRRKKWSQAILLVGFAGMYVYYICVTGISFFQGDRLVIATMPVWIIAYIFYLHSLWMYWFPSRHSNDSK